MNSPLITVYITNYNYGKYLCESIESVFGQNIDDYELYIIDDGSTDNSRELLKKYQQRENVYIIYQKNKGLIASNNLALKLARGEFIIRLDADDYLEAHALEILSTELLKNPDTALVFPDYYLVDEDGEVIALRQRHNFNQNVSLYDQPAHGACTMIRTSVLREIGGYDSSLTCQDGYDLWLNVSQNYPVRNVNLPLFSYRQHAVSLTTNEEKILSNRSKIKEKHAVANGSKELSVVAVLPVRGAAFDPRSNPLVELGGKKLIDWTVETALGNKKLTATVVTTPDQEVIDYLQVTYGDRVTVIKRNVELSRINTPIEATVSHALEMYQEDSSPPDAIMLLYIEYPFRSSMYIDKAINTMRLYDVDVVDGVRLEDGMLYVHSGHGLEPWNKNRRLRLERNDLYRRSGGIHLVKREVILGKGDMLDGKIGHIAIGRKGAVAVRSKLDLEYARVVAELDVDS